VRYRYKGPGTTPGNSPNTGTVELSLTPYTAGFVSGTPWVGSKSTTLPQFNTETKVDILFPNASRPSAWATFETEHGQIDFVCATMKLKNFTRNDDLSNDSHNVNHNEFTTSEYQHHFFVSGDDLPGLKAEESGTLFIRLQSLNDPQVSKPGKIGLFFPRVTVTRWWLLWVMLGLLSWFALRRRSVMVARFACLIPLLVTATLVVAGCKHLSSIRTARWEITNARALGLRPVKSDSTLYQMPIAQGQIKRIDLRFVGHPLPYQTVRRELRPATDTGEPNIHSVPVRPGGVITVLAFGEIDLDGPNGPLPATSATGIVLPGAATNHAGEFVLRAGYYNPSQNAGTLIGSFDGFATNSFVIGRNNSIVVPRDAGILSVAVNAARGSYRAITGSFQLFTIDNDLPPVPTHTMNPGDATGHVPPSIDSWRVLTSLNVYTYHKTQVLEPRRGIASETLNPIGAAHYVIYDSHVR